MAFLETSGGVNLHYETRGNGTPVLLVHGWGTSAAIWRFQEELADSCRLISIDLRGHGRSGALSGGYRISDLASDLTDLFDALDLRGAILAGWSLGSQVVLDSFPRLRERLAGLVLVSGTPRFTRADGYTAGLPASEPRRMAAGLRRDYHKVMGEFFRSMFAPDELSREQQKRIGNEIVIPGRLPEPAVALATLDILMTADLRAGLSAIDRPVLLIHGTADTICPPAASLFMASQLPNARLRMLDGVGHAPFLSRGSDFNRMIRGFDEELHGGN
jgi:pimeloyl-[acyl-carrier protein] methyl ester esterase